MYKQKFQICAYISNHIFECCFKALKHGEVIQFCFVFLLSQLHFAVTSPVSIACKNVYYYISSTKQEEDNFEMQVLVSDSTDSPLKDNSENVRLESISLKEILY